MTLKGIDIASYQKNLNCENIDADFVIIKATQGTSYVNPYCDMHYQQSVRAGQLQGVYHYAEGGDPQAEAAFFLKNVEGYIHKAILCLDWESQQNARWGNKDAEWVKAFCDYVYDKVQVHPIVYVQASAMSRLACEIGDCGMWIAQYASNEPTGYQEHPWNEDAYMCAIRQYSSHGRIYGYDGDLDLDIAYMDDAAWHKYANPAGDYKPSQEPQKQPFKSVEQLADEVIAGQWGDGAERKERLSAAGYDYTAVQNAVNAKLTPAKKSNEEIAQEVIAGQWGNGQDRVNRLNAAGYDANAIQSLVNNKVGATQAVYHTIREGETLSGIAAKYGTTWQRLQQMNGISNPNLIYAGQRIRVK